MWSISMVLFSCSWQKVFPCISICKQIFCFLQIFFFFPGLFKECCLAQFCKCGFIGMLFNTRDTTLLPKDLYNTHSFWGFNSYINLMVCSVCQLGKVHQAWTVVRMCGSCLRGHFCAHGIVSALLCGIQLHILCWNPLRSHTCGNTSKLFGPSY